MFITFQQKEEKTFHIWHTYSTNNAISNDTKVDDLVTLSITFELQIHDFTATRGI